MPADWIYLAVPLRTLDALPTLTAAERAVLLGLTRGWANARVAAERGVAVRTVANQIRGLFDKLQVRSRVALLELVSDVALDAAPVADGAPASRRTRHDHPTLFLVDDHAPTRAELTRFFERAGYDVLAAASLEEARMAIAPSASIDVALLDVRLGDGRALDLLTPLPPFPCVLLSGVAELDEVFEGLALGARDFVEKGAALDQLLITVGDALASCPPAGIDPHDVDLTRARPGDVGTVVTQLYGGALVFVGSADRQGVRHHLFRTVNEAPLSGRETDLLVGTLRGEPVKSLALSLEISEATAYTTLGNVLARLGFEDRLHFAGVLGWSRDRAPSRPAGEGRP